MDEVSSIGAGTRAGLPYALPTLLLGLSFGALAAPVTGGLAAVVMSLGVVSGGAQTAALTVLTGGGTAVAAAAAGVLVNARWLPLGFAAAPHLAGGRLRRGLEAQAIVDASYVIASRGDGTVDRGLLIGAVLPQALSWVVGTAGGVLLGPALGDPRSLGLDALFVAFYATLLWGDVAEGAVLRGWARPVAATLLGGVITLALLPVAPVGVPVLASSLACLVGWSRR